MTFKDILKQNELKAVAALTARACLANKLSKATRNQRDRNRFRVVKCRAHSGLLVLKAATPKCIDENGLVVVRLQNEREHHVPLDRLSEPASRIVESVLRLKDL